MRNQREAQRKKIYINDGVFIHLQTLYGSQSGHCLDLSLSGVAACFEPFEDQPGLQIGCEVLIEIESPFATSSLLKAVIKNIGEQKIKDKIYTRVGLKFIAANVDPLIIAKKIGAPIHEITEYLRPIASCQDPIFTGGLLFFKINGFSRNGAALVTSTRNAGLFPGITLKINFLLPNIGELFADVHIINIDQTSADRNLLHVAFVQPSPRFLGGVTEYLMISNNHLTLRTLKKDGFFSDFNENAFFVTYCSSQQDWADILNLRLKAYQSVGKFTDKKSADEMQDRFDAYGRHIVCKVGSTIVGAFRIIFVDKDKTRSEHIALNIPLPDWLFNFSFVEVSRLCIDKEFRHSDALTILLRRCFEIAAQTQTHYVLANCNSDMWPLYKKVGFKKLGVRFEAFGRKDCEMITADVHRILNGKDATFMAWNVFFLSALENLMVTMTWESTFQKLIRKIIILVHKMIQKPILLMIRRKKYLAHTHQNSHISIPKNQTVPSHHTSHLDNLLHLKPKLKKQNNKEETKLKKIA